MTEKKRTKKMMRHLISWQGVSFYIILLVMFLDVIGLNPNSLINQVTDTLFSMNLLSFKFWITMISMFVFGYIIPENIRVGLLNKLSHKKITFQARPFYYDGKWQL